ncbi:MAG: tRNA (N(6)-L-threonylcarbamoyladenosine(37)-C(2))-methylthiotransferase MtaB [Muribaculaceae bacterium]|nr:tRNA (N(6)-L-threonylcarbamoyladenosine(37)-C(2))-methylthiotransferase MtaB [Muribaculaceae bacterium]
MIDRDTFGNRTALFHTFGCKLNFSETSSIARQLAEKGIRRITPGETPDIIVVNTCSVTELADKKCRQTIRSLHRRFPQAAILVTGCYAQLKSDEVAGLPGVAVVAGTDRKDRIVDFLDKFMADGSNTLSVDPARDFRHFTPSCECGDRTRYFLKVQDGCDYWCSYCTIPAARGRSRSGTIDQMVAQAADVAARGGKEIVITGVNIGDFGRLNGESFADLVRALDQVEGIERYRISSIEPNLLTDDIIDFVAASRRFMPHFHIPLQSGSDEVLRLMRRRYDTALFAHKINCIRQAMPHAFIGIDLIVGARGETEEYFHDSCRFIESLPLSRLHVFTYSERPGTRALEIPHVVSEAEKHKRTRHMLAISERMLTQFTAGFEGSVSPMLFEHPRRAHPCGGFTDNYLKVELQNLPQGFDPMAYDNRIVPVRLGRPIPERETVEGFLV